MPITVRNQFDDLLEHGHTITEVVFNPFKIVEAEGIQLILIKAG
jgi:hypothetical protein